MRDRRPLLLLLVLVACRSADGSEAPAVGDVPEPAARRSGESGPTHRSDAGTSGTNSDASTPDGPNVARGDSNLRIMTGNISSGDSSTYDSGEGIRMFRGLHPDVALIQELNYKDNTTADLNEFVSTAFGEGYTYFQESGVQIPNGIVSRFPMLTSGRWADPNVYNRGFAYAKIALPGAHALWAVSVHLLTTGSANRNAEATELVAQLASVIAEGDYVVIGGDFNTDGRNESCLTTLRQIVDTQGAYPADKGGNAFTNGPRNKPYDWVAVSPALRALQVPTVIGPQTFASGLVFDSRVFTPLEDVAPVKGTDSSAVNMQHMPVVKDFHIVN